MNYQSHIPLMLLLPPFVSNVVQTNAGVIVMSIAHVHRFEFVHFTEIAHVPIVAILKIVVRRMLNWR